MKTSGQPYLRAQREHRPGPWASAWRHSPLFFAGLLVAWGSAVLLVLPDRQALDTPTDWAPALVHAVWAALFVYAGILLLVWPRRDASEEAEDRPLGRRLLRLPAAVILLLLLLGLFRVGVQVVLACGGQDPWADPMRTVVVPLVVLAASLALFALLGALLVPVRPRLLSVVLGWALWFLVRAGAQAAGADDVVGAAAGHLLDPGWYWPVLVEAVSALV